MKDTGIIRRVDKLGRIVIAVELRGTFDLKHGDLVEMFVRDKKIVLRKYDPNVKHKEGTVGVIRKVDKLGRIVIAIEIRAEFNILAGDGMHLFLNKDEIILEKHEPNCIFCDSSKGLKDFKGKHVCHKCLQKMVAMSECKKTA